MKVVFEEEIIMTWLDDEIVLFNQKNGKYFTLNSVGARVWELLQEYCDTDDVLAAMLREYNVDESILRYDIEKLIMQLEKSELLVSA